MYGEGEMCKAWHGLIRGCGLSGKNRRKCALHHAYHGWDHVRPSRFALAASFHGSQRLPRISQVQILGVELYLATRGALWFRLLRADEAIGCPEELLTQVIVF